MHELTVDLASAVPAFEQVRAQIAGHIAAGTLREGDRLPTVRDLASDLGLAPGTVQRAYRELEALGLVVSRRRHGTSVRARQGSSDGGAHAAVVAAVRTLADAAHEAQMAEADVLDLVRAVMREPVPAPE